LGKGGKPGGLEREKKKARGETRPHERRLVSHLEKTREVGKLVRKRGERWELAVGGGVLPLGKNNGIRGGRGSKSMELLKKAGGRKRVGARGSTRERGGVGGGGKLWWGGGGIDSLGLRASYEKGNGPEQKRLKWGKKKRPS